MGLLRKAKKAKNKSNKKFEIRIQIGIIWFLFLVVIILGSAIHFPWLDFSTKNISTLVIDLNKEIIRGVNSEIKPLFSNALLIMDVIKKSFENGIVDIYNKNEREQFYLDLLKANLDFTWISFGFTNGDFFGAQHEREKGELRIVNRIWDGYRNTSVQYTDFYPKNNNKYEFYSSSVENDYNYNSTKRSWYKLAANDITPVWTDIYQFSSTKLAGLNTAVSLHINGKFIGVISIAFELEDISTYLGNEIKIGNNEKEGRVYIINNKNQLIGSQIPEEIQFKTVVNDGNESKVLRELSDINNPYTIVLNNSINENKIPISDLKGFTYEKYYYPETGESYFTTFMPAFKTLDDKHKSLEDLEWIIATSIPDSIYLGEIAKNSFNLLIFLLVLIIISSVFFLFLTKFFIANPILKISGQLSYIKNFDLSNINFIPSYIKEINQLSRAMVQMTQGLVSFQKYIPTELVKEMISQGIEAEIGGEERELTIFFSDIVSFTSIFEKEGNRLIHQLGEYLSEMSIAILNQKGSIDKYIGDSIMAFWGAPVRNKDHAVLACRAAVNCKRILASLRMQWKDEGKPQLYARIGMNTGTVVVGNIGSIKRLNYTVMGDPVNLSSRLESLNKTYKTEILIGQNTYEKAKDEIVARKIDTVAVYGKTEKEDIYELLLMKDDVRVTDNFEWINLYEEAQTLYKNRKWDEAVNLFKKSVKKKGEKDYPSMQFILNCRKFKENPPPTDWDGTTIMKTK